MTTPPTSPAATLISHPDFPAPPVAGIAVAVRPAPGGGLTLAYRLDGDLTALRLPSPEAAVEPDRLWAHTCFEVFLVRGEQPAYREYNFSPSGQWAAYAFSDYRQRDDRAAPLSTPLLAWCRDTGSLALEATLPPLALPLGEGPLHLALSTVVELQDGSLSYWALQHSAPRPDFHHRGGFVLSLP